MIRPIFVALSTALLLLAGTAAQAADANAAGVAELEAVKGIGPALSGKIIDARKQAPFKSWSDLVDRVPGLGPANAARLSQNGLTVAGAAYAGAAPVAAARPPARPATGEPAAKPSSARPPAAPKS